MSRVSFSIRPPLKKRLPPGVDPDINYVMTAVHISLVDDTATILLPAFRRDNTHIMWIAMEDWRYVSRFRIAEKMYLGWLNQTAYKIDGWSSVKEMFIEDED